MSLLLDAMKKSGDQSQSTGLSHMTLEDAPPSKAKAEAAATGPGSANASRTAGQTLFAAKKKKEIGRAHV